MTPCGAVPTSPSGYRWHSFGLVVVASLIPFAPMLGLGVIFGHTNTTVASFLVGTALQILFPLLRGTDFGAPLLRPESTAQRTSARQRRAASGTRTAQSPPATSGAGDPLAPDGYSDANRPRGWYVDPSPTGPDALLGGRLQTRLEHPHGEDPEADAGGMARAQRTQPRELSGRLPGAQPPASISWPRFWRWKGRRSGSGEGRDHLRGVGVKMVLSDCLRRGRRCQAGRSWRHQAGISSPSAHRRGWRLPGRCLCRSSSWQLP